MLLDPIIEPISDLSTLAAQGTVEWIADHSSLKRDGWALTIFRFLVACLAFLTIAVGIPVLAIALIWWAAIKFLF